MRLKDGTEVEIGWDGVPMNTSPYLAFDTETDTKPRRDSAGKYVRDAKGQVIPTNDLNKEVPALACLQVTNGRRNVIVKPEQIVEFLEEHAGATWVGHNVAFDWSVIDMHLWQKAQGAPGNGSWEYATNVRAAWAVGLKENRVRDTMLLDFLARLADPTQLVTHLRSLDELAQGWLRMRPGEVDKKSDYRLRFGELIGADWSEVDPGFWEYAAKDAITTHALYARIFNNLPSWYAVDGHPLNWRTHGPLTECLQTRAAVVLAEVGRNGFLLDASQVDEARKRLKTLIDEKAAEVESLAPGIFRRYKVATKTARPGDLMLHNTTGTPSVNQAVLRAALTQVAEEHDVAVAFMPRTKKTDLLTTALDPWREAAGDSPLVKSWAELTDASKLHQFLCQLSGKAEVNASYVPLVRTGRTSCRKPNVQQMPKAPWLRGLFVARPGHKLVIVDYSAIELVTLAAVCLKRFGKSVLAETIKSGRDPHAFTAALVQGVDYAEFFEGLQAEKRAWKEARLNAGAFAPPKDYQNARQAAKAVNFGVPGGLGSVKLAAYAKANYGVALDPNEAARLRYKLIHDVYPELSLYLQEDSAALLAANLGKTREEVGAAFQRHLRGEVKPWFYGYVEKVLSGNDAKADGKKINHLLRQAVWDGMADLTVGTRWHAQCRDQKGDGRLWRATCCDRAVTLTGRVRAGLSYTETRNTPFQGLAADGAKVALYRLWEAGHRIVAFVHDEVVCEVPEEDALRRQVEIEQVMIESMSSVLDCDIPVKVEGTISERWVKW